MRVGQGISCNISIVQTIWVVNMIHVALLGILCNNYKDFKQKNIYEILPVSAVFKVSH